ncbi:hypothetical protein PFCIP103579_0346 [Prolinoborus fasciculus]|uniref:hypothetical protein n=1 Tax=Acinetobacter lwoffii TaxID=28090 RepID=UPI000A327282|nr:hypothetical protein [Prolinoborus fasciculus]AUC05524.1 hypothetical protein BVG18_00500 [Acinetobacter lwoffii]SPJ19202.1 hypothetical protein PFCIP103579_0346 [Prolinoborus fasciculus]
MIKQLEPAEIIRDQYGFWTHPVFSEYLDHVIGDSESMTLEQFEELKQHFNVDFSKVEMEFDASEEVASRYWDHEELEAVAYWNPSKPKGDADWFLVSINDTEDGPVAWWAKPKNTIDKQVNLMDQFIESGEFNKTINDFFGLPESVVQSLKEVS